MSGDAGLMIRLERVTKSYPDGTVAVRELSLDVPEGALVTLVGPSGCGKTTTMKMVNRLVEPTSGRIFLAGEDVTRVDPVSLRRRIGYVIQQVGLFPHRTILDNTATVPDLLGWKRAKARSRACELLDLVGLDPATYGDRYPHQLSGGQRQRVGVARALAADPPVLLMDEPFGAVDPVARERLQQEFLRLQSELRKTVLLVTHDIEEAVRLGDRIAVFAPGGRIEQYDTPVSVLGSPATPYVAEFVGADRGLKRLSVTGIGREDLETPPVVGLDDDMAVARSRLRAGGSRWAVVLGDHGAPYGWIEADAVQEGEGLVRDRARQAAGWVPLGSTLRQALGEMLRHEVGWVGVVDGGRYLGVLTPARLHDAARRPVKPGVPSSAPDRIEPRPAPGTPETGDGSGR